jgi:hypothetical protein
MKTLHLAIVISGIVISTFTYLLLVPSTGIIPDDASKIANDTAFKLSEHGWGSLVISNVNTMHIADTKFTANYTIINAKLLNITDDIQSLSAIIKMQTNSDGNLIITLPLELLKPTITNQHNSDEWIVLDDGQETTHLQTKITSTDITFLIPFVNGTQEIEIIGTQVG